MGQSTPVWVLAFLLADSARALNNGLAKTPSMGWNNWNSFGCSVSESLVVGTAQRIPQLGLRDVGYNYVVLDDCWSSQNRASDKQLVADPSKFPNGMKSVADKVHAQGLKYGMYSTAGTLTCARYPASLGYETVDAKTFASWGVDYLKYDNCYNNGQSGTQQKSYERYKKMSDALLATGRSILYSMCNWGEDQPWKWAAPIANSWRMSGDITDSFDAEHSGCPCKAEQGESCFGGYSCSAMNILNKVAAYSEKGGPGAWNDLDMLEVGNGRMTDTEYVTHFTMWAVVKSILIMGHDVRKTSAKALSILLNPAVIAVNQDPAGIPAVRKWVRGSLQLWSGPLSGGDQVVTLLNLGGSQQSMSATLADIFGSSGGASKSWDVYDLWGNRMSDSQANAIINNPSKFGGGTDLSGVYYNATARPYAVGLAAGDAILMGKKIGSVAAQGTLQANVPSHGVAAFRLRPAGGASTSTKPPGSSASTPAPTSSSVPMPTQTSTPGTVPKYGQCGGINYNGPTQCEAGSTCKFSNDWYSQCL